MTMIRKPEEALEHIRENARGVYHGNHYIHAADTVTADNLAALAACVESRSPLPSCEGLEESLRKPHNYAALCDIALTAMFSEAELSDYFLDVLVSMHEDEETWEKPDELRLCKMITGSSYKSSASPNPIMRIFRETFRNRFPLFRRYPAQIKNRAVEAIRRREPLVEISREFVGKYCSRSRSTFLLWFDNCVVEEVGEEEFSAYVRDMVEKYASGLPDRNYRHFSYMRLTAYIFGCSWRPVERCRKDRARGYGKQHNHIRLQEILAREMLPYTYATTPDRAAVYDFLDLSPEERACYDEKAARVDKSLVPAGLLAAGASQLAVPELPDGVSFEELLGAYDAFFAGRYLVPDSPRGPILPLHRFRRDFKEHLEAEDARMYAAFRAMRRTPALESAFNEHLEDKISGLRRLMFDGNAGEVASDKAEVWIYVPKGETFIGRRADFSALDGAGTFQQDAREFLRFLYQDACQRAGSDPRALVRIPDTMDQVLRLLTLLAGEYGITCPEDVGEAHILAALSRMSKEGVAPGMLRRRLTQCRKFFRFLVGSRRLKADPTANLTVKSGFGYSKATPEIPEDILAFLEAHIDELGSSACKLMLKLAMETGWRLSDIRSIRVEDIAAKDPASGMPQVKARSPKTAASRIKLRLGDKIFAVISPELHGEIAAYIEETSALREMYEVDTLFFCITNGVKTDFPATTINGAINRLLERHGIQSINEDWEAFTFRQTRKTVAVELITSGATLTDVQKQLGHVTHATAERIYAEVRMKRLAELNSEFFQQRFGLLIESGRLDLYTEEERRWLYVDFCTNRRNVELGVCSKHPSEGRCADLGNISCASCPKLCTGRAFQARWQELYEDSSRLLEQFEGKYAELGIPRDEYEGYTEYAQERTLNERYRAVLDAIEEGASHA
ncbi:MAG: tyrosine-type recombinase/integrase [Coriobacteriales bacterium]